VGDDRRADRATGLVTLLGFGVGLHAWSAGLSDPYLINDDVRQTLYFVRRAVDPSLFPNDLLTRYAENYQPWGFVLLYRSLAPWVDPILLGKVLGIALVGLAAGLVFRLVNGFAGITAAAIAALLFLASPGFIAQLSGGNPRAFAPLLVFLFLDALVRERPGRAALWVVVQSLFYPVVFALSTLAFALGSVRVRGGALRRRIGLVALAALVGAGLQLGKTVASADPEFGPVVTRADMEGDPAYGPDGRFPVLPVPGPVETLARVAAQVLPKSAVFDRLGDSGGPQLAVLALLLAAAVLGVRRGGAPLPFAIASFAIAGLVLYAVASAVMMHLFLPVRYLEHAFRAVFLVIAAVGIAGAIRWIPSRPGERVALVVACAWLFFHVFDHRYTHLYDHSEIRPVARFLSTLPKDVLVAAHPRVADDIPTFAGRAVFVSYELAHPFLRATYWATVEARLDALLDAYYAERPEAVAEFVRRNGVTHLVVDRRHFEAERIAAGALGFAPFDDRVRQRVGGRTRFALAAIPEAWKLFEDGPYSVLDAAAIAGTAQR